MSAYTFKNIKIRCLSLNFARKFILFIDHPFYLSHCLVNTSWLQKLVHLADIFTGLNELILSCQGKSMSIYTNNSTAPFLILWWDWLKVVGSCTHKSILRNFQTTQAAFSFSTTLIQGLNIFSYYRQMYHSTHTTYNDQ